MEVEAWRAGLWTQALRQQPKLSALEERGDIELERLGAQLQRRFRDSRIEAFKFLPAVSDLLRALRERHGLTLVIITNGHHTVQADKVASCGARDLVDHVIIGGEEIAAGRHEKPHASIYNR